MGSSDDDWKDYNFIWTQWRRKNIILTLKKYESPKKSNINLGESLTTQLTDYSSNDNFSEKDKSLSIHTQATSTFAVPNQSSISSKANLTDHAKSK